MQSLNRLASPGWAAGSCPTAECPTCQPHDVKAESPNGTITHALAMLPGGRLITLEPSQPGGQGQYFVFWEWFPFLQSKCSSSLFSLYIISSLFSILCRTRVFCNAEVKQEGMCLTPFGGKGCLPIGDQAENWSTSVVSCVFRMSCRVYSHYLAS